METLIDAADPLAELVGTCEGKPHFFGGIALRRNQCRTKRELKIEFKAIPVNRIGSSLEQFEGATHVIDRLHISRPLDGMCAGTPPIPNGGLWKTRLGVVVGH